MCLNHIYVKTLYFHGDVILAYIWILSVVNPFPGLVEEALFLIFQDAPSMSSLKYFILKTKRNGNIVPSFNMNFPFQFFIPSNAACSYPKLFV